MIRDWLAVSHRFQYIPGTNLQEREAINTTKYYIECTQNAHKLEVKMLGFVRVLANGI